MLNKELVLQSLSRPEIGIWKPLYKLSDDIVALCDAVTEVSDSSINKFNDANVLMSEGVDSRAISDSVWHYYSVILARLVSGLSRSTPEACVIFGYWILDPYLAYAPREDFSKVSTSTALVRRLCREYWSVNEMPIESIQNVAGQLSRRSLDIGWLIEVVSKSNGGFYEYMELCEEEDIAYKLEELLRYPELSETNDLELTFYYTFALIEYLLRAIEGELVSVDACSLFGLAHSVLLVKLGRSGPDCLLSRIIMHLSFASYPTLTEIKDRQTHLYARLTFPRFCYISD